MFIGEIVLEGVFKLLEEVGIEFKPPFLLKEHGKFPDCSHLLQEFRPSKRTNREQLDRYVRLCRLTAAAWALWLAIAVGLFYCTGIVFYHLWHDWPHVPLEHTWGFFGFSNMLPIQAAAEIRCKDLVFGILAMSLTATTAYSMIVGFVRRAARALISKSNHTPPRAVAAS